MSLAMLSTVFWYPNIMTNPFFAKIVCKVHLSVMSVAVRLVHSLQ